MSDTQSINIVDPGQWGVSFSIKQCRNFGIDPEVTLRWLITEGGFRRFRLMSYWNEHEPEPGKYQFKALDTQFDLAERYGCVITLCLGARQPRWPENHWPAWAWQADYAMRTEALLRYIRTVVERYRDRQAIVSYQLENEALLRAFGERPEVNRSRLRAEYQLIKELDPKRPLIMTTSTSWGIPLRRPIPDTVGFSYYRILFRQGKYRHALHLPSLDKLRAGAIRLIHQKPSFIHELQLEPWGPTAIWKMPIAEQDKSMGLEQIKANISLARRTKLKPIDLWGGEWWYWRLTKLHDPSIWQTVKRLVS